MSYIYIFKILLLDDIGTNLHCGGDNVSGVGQYPAFQEHDDSSTSPNHRVSVRSCRQPDSYYGPRSRV